MNWIRRYRSIPEKKKIIWYGKLAFWKNLFVFSFKVTVGIYYQSWFLLAIAIYQLFIGYVKNNCSRGLNKNKESIRAINTYIRGGVVLALSSIFYIIYSIFQIYYPSSFDYNMVIALAIAVYAFYSIGMSIWGVVSTKGKTMLIKEYKFTNFATAFNNLVLAQIAIFSFTTSDNMAVYNGLMGVAVGLVVTIIGIYLIVDGILKKKKYYQLLKNYPDFFKYIPE